MANVHQTALDFKIPPRLPHAPAWAWPLTGSSGGNYVLRTA